MPANKDSFLLLTFSLAPYILYCSFHSSHTTCLKSIEQSWWHSRPYTPTPKFSLSSPFTCTEALAYAACENILIIFNFQMPSHISKWNPSTLSYSFIRFMKEANSFEPFLKYFSYIVFNACIWSRHPLHFQQPFFLWQWYIFYGYNSAMFFMVSGGLKYYHPRAV